jgi:hypothetical protein
LVSNLSRLRTQPLAEQRLDQLRKILIRFQQDALHGSVSLFGDLTYSPA